MGEWAARSSDQLGVPGTLLYENDRVRVWELIMRPGDVCQWHDHPYDHLLVVTSGAQIEGATATGETIHLDINDNQTFFIPRSNVPEIARNVSPDKTLRELIIDFKDPSSAKGELSVFDFFAKGTPTTVASGNGHS
jgi:hypothetical protein